MSARLQVSMALFDVAKFSFVHDENLHPSAILQNGFHTPPPSVATVQWITDPALGFPDVPHEVGLLPDGASVEQYGFHIHQILIGAATGFGYSLLHQVPAEDGALCITARIFGTEENTQIYAIDVLGREVPGTRQTANAPNGAAFLGPQIFGLKATGEVGLGDVVVFRMPPESTEFVVVARVAPPFSSVPEYDNQEYMDQQLDRERALERRLWADALARQNTPVPQACDLEGQIHRRNPHDYSAWLRRRSLFDLTDANFAALKADPTLKVGVDLGPNAPMAEIQPGYQWQYLATLGPIEATTMGQGVTIPLDLASPVPKTGQALFERVQSEQRLPYPLVRVTSVLTSQNGQQAYRSYGRLILESDRMECRLDAPIQRKPTTLDGAATTDLELRLSGSRLHTGHFISREVPGARKFEIDTEDPNRAPKLFAYSGEPDDPSETGAPALRFGPVDVPFETFEDQKVFDQPRDAFGRWPKEFDATCTLAPWPVAAPTAKAPSIEYRGDGRVEFTVDIGWDWDIRTPFELRVGMTISSEPDALDKFRPESGVVLPEVKAPPILIRFDASGTSYVEGGSGAPLKLSLAEIGAPAGTERTYRLVGDLGSFDGLFSQEERTRLVFAADAFEAVSGQTEDRRSKTSRVSADLVDPRPPELVGEQWALHWASRANGANVSIARLPRPTIEAGPKIAGFYLWRASDTAIVGLGVQTRYGNGPKAAAIAAATLSEGNKRIRLEAIKALVQDLLGDPAFSRKFVNLFAAADTNIKAGDIEVALAGTTSGLEFAMYTATSKTGISSEKTNFAHLVAIAVPQHRPLARPMLRLYVEDEMGILALKGYCLALIGTSKDIEAKDIRLYWDDSGAVTTADDLMYEVERLVPITLLEATKYLPEVDKVAARMGSERVHAILVNRPQSWSQLSFSVEVASEPTDMPEERSVSPRSNMVKTFIPPGHGPRLTVREDPSAAGRIIIEQAGLYLIPVPGFENSEAYFAMGDFQLGPLPLGNFEAPAALGSAWVKYDPTISSFVIDREPGSGNQPLKLVCIDPAGRPATIVV